MKETLKLMPCAHCGSTDVHLVRSVRNAPAVLWHVECMDCGIRTNDYEESVGNVPASSYKDYDAVVTDMELAIECAVGTWNTRA